MNNQKIKNYIKLIWVISLIVLIIDLYDLVFSCIYFTSAFDIGLSVFDVGCAVFSLTVFLVMSNKDIEYLKKNFALIVTATVLAFLSSIIAGIIGIILCNNLKNWSVANANTGSNKPTNTQSTPTNKESNSQTETKTEIYPAEELLVKLKTLQNMKTTGEITDEEYEQIKQKMIDDFKNSVK